jgi:hypothetical protein
MKLPNVEYARSLSRRIAASPFLFGLIALVICVVWGFADPKHFYRAYLFAWLCCLGVAGGAMCFVMIHHASGGAWGFMIRRIGEAAGMTLPVLTVLFLPIMLGGKWIFPWADHDMVHHSPLLKHREPFFMTEMVYVRSLGFLILWSFIAWRLRSLSVRHDRTGDPVLLKRAERLSVIGLILYFLTMSFAAVDWIASREIDFYSSTFGAMTVLGQACAGLCVLIIVLAILYKKPPIAEIFNENRLHDIGNLLLTSVVLWSYVSFAQYLVIWIGNTQEDNVWFYHRTRSAWMVIGVMLMLLHFAVPFVMLLFQSVKRRPESLAVVAAGVLLMRVLDVLWMVAPSSHHPEHPESIHWLDFVSPFALGGLWTASFLYFLARQPLNTRAYDVAMQAYVNPAHHGTAHGQSEPIA